MIIFVNKQYNTKTVKKRVICKKQHALFFYKLKYRVKDLIFYFYIGGYNSIGRVYALQA